MSCFVTTKRQRNTAGMGFFFIGGMSTQRIVAYERATTARPPRVKILKHPDLRTLHTTHGPCLAPGPGLGAPPAGGAGGHVGREGGEGELEAEVGAVVDERAGAPAGAFVVLHRDRSGARVQQENL